MELGTYGSTKDVSASRASVAAPREYKGGRPEAAFWTGGLRAIKLDSVLKHGKKYRRATCLLHVATVIAASDTSHGQLLVV